VLSYYESQAEYQSKRHNYKVALDYQKKYSNLYEKIYNTQQVKQVQTLQAKFENQRKESEILSLNLANKDAQLLLAEKNENIRNKNLTMVVLGSIILLIVVIYQFFLQRQKTTIHTAKIEKMEAIYQGQEIIKKRIARDLHDIITTNFDGLRLRVLALKRSSRISKSIDGITEDLKKMNQQIRLVSHRLYPLEMYMGKQKFTDIVKSRLSEFQLYGNVFVELEDQLPDLLNKLPIGVQNNLYGILLEVLNNVEKHALATKLNIKNFKDGRGNLHIVFEDNGIGIKNQHREGIGLMNIKQRVEILEGNCSISKTQIGTKVHIDFPLPKTI
jgi:signal transduction histidine kinase